MKIVTEKFMDRDVRMRRILDILGLTNVSDLPVEYVRGGIYFSGRLNCDASDCDALDLGGVVKWNDDNKKHATCALIHIGDEFPEDDFQDTVDFLRECSKRLEEINKKIEEVKKVWCGMETIEI